MIERLQAAAASWIGTPFFPHGRTKGEHGGCSCQTFVASCYVEAGFLPSEFVIPEGPLETGYEQILAFMHTLPVFQLAAPPAQAGDLMLFKIGRQGHLAICLGRKLIHCLRDRGVHYSLVDDATYLKRLTHIWRPTQ